MKHDDPQLIDALAAEYVLGTLRGRARLRFERWRAAEWHVDRRVQAWEERLAPLASGIAPIQPSPEVWRKIEQRISISNASHKRRPAWRTIAAGTVLFALLMGGMAVWHATQAPDYQALAMIQQPNGEMVWKVEMDPEAGHMRLNAMPTAPRQSDRSFELWALPDGGAAPVSLGVLPETGVAEHALSNLQLAALRNTSKVAVSLEPRGGSATGAPTGPVLFIAERLNRA